MSGRLDLYVFIDAFGWDLLERNQFLQDIAPFRTKVETIFGYSSTCIPTILTGKMPREHGHFSFFYYNPKESPFRACRVLRALPKSLANRGRVRRMMSKALQKWYGYTGYFQIYNMPFRWIDLFDYSEKKDLYRPGGINGGCKTIFDEWAERDVPFHVSDWRRPEAFNIAEMREKIGEGKIRAGYLYTAALDALLHQHGKGGEHAAAKIAWYDRELRALYEHAQHHYDEVCISVFSDHGMHEIREDWDLIPMVEALGHRFGKDYAAVYDSTMARFWFFDDAARRDVTDLLSRQTKGRILSEGDLERFGTPRNTYGELFFLLDGGVLLNPSFLGETSMAGMHGYDPADADSMAMFVSSEEPPYVPKRLDDHYGIMAALGERTPVAAL